MAACHKHDYGPLHPCGSGWIIKDIPHSFSGCMKNIEEIYPDHLTSVEITNYLAKLKANAFDGEIESGELLITSDTIVWLNNVALGKPKDYDDAVSILKTLSNQTHEVITSVCFKTKSKTTLIHDITKVTFNKLSDETIHYYISTYKPFDKAGSYGAQDFIGLVGIAKLEGSYFNVMGLPTHMLYAVLKERFGKA
jgi:septum formation protein